MNIDDFIKISSMGVQVAMLVSAPVLLLGLIAGVSVSIVQAATQINDGALAFVPKIAAVMGALIVFGPWMVSQMAAFATYTFNQIPNITY